MDEEGEDNIMITNDKMNLVSLKKELSYYKRMIIPKEDTKKNFDYLKVEKRDKVLFEANRKEFEDRLFLVDVYGKYRLVGYKIIKNYFENNGKDNIIMDSRVTADMLLGIYSGLDEKNDKIYVTYFPLKNGEKLFAFDLVKDDADIELSFPLVTTADLTVMSTWMDFWPNRSQNWPKERLIQFLSDTEPHLRKYSEQVLKKMKKDKFTIYDPACSTGEYLKYIKEKFKKAYTIGHDIDENMIKIAKNFVDECTCCNAEYSPIVKESIDILVLRFLNYSVVNSKTAERLFEILLTTVKKDGIIICFGHTPILLNAVFFKQYNLEVIGKIGYEESTNSIFQFYVIIRQTLS